MKAIIVEDEKLAADRLQRMVRKVSPETEITAVLGSVEEAVDYLKKEVPDLIFLDIHLSDGSSFGIFEQVEVSSPVIFTTAYDEYALKAFKVNSIDYLLKPIAEEALAQSLQKLRKLQRNPGVAMSDLERMLSAFRNKEPLYRHRFMVAYGSKIKTIKTEDIAYFYADSKAVFLVEKSGGKYVLDETLDQLQETLDPGLFFRANRGFIVGIEAIEQMYGYSRSRIKVELNPPCAKECIVSTEKTPDFKGWLSM